MNETIKKYAKILKDIVLKTKDENFDRLSDLFIKKLQENGHLLYGKSIIAEARRLAHLDIERSRVLIRSAKKLTKNEREKITKDIRDKHGENLIFVERVDPHLISGIVVELCGMKIDMSMYGRIKKLKEHLS